MLTTTDTSQGDAVTSLESTIAVSPRVLFRDLGDEAVLLDLESGRYFGLDEVGTRIWALLTEHRTIAPILDTLQHEYDTSHDRMRRDLLGFIDRLVDQQLVTRDG